MKKSKEQKRAEAQARQNAHSWQRVDIPIDTPATLTDINRQISNIKQYEKN